MNIDDNDLCFEYKSYAKINLFLDVTSRLENGFHTIKSIFSEITLYDVIKYKENGLNYNRFFDNKSLLSEDNLLKKASDVFFKNIKGNPVGLDFYVDKEIPIGGGLGGGSSNGAAVLKILNNYYKSGFDTFFLENISSSIGSDVPFFIKGGLQEVSGIGDKLKKLSVPKLDLFFLLVFPDLSVSTPYAYSLIDKNDCCADTALNRKIYDDFLSSIYANNYSGIVKNVYNKFETVVFDEYPLLNNIKLDILNTNADAAFMSGSGSTMVGIYSSSEKLSSGANTLRNDGYRVQEAEILF